jgi:pimeloyl-ACP methyl ester carboxylesterase
MTTEYDIYLMPGLGLNHHIFDQLSFRSGNVYYLNWLEPQVDESLSSYTRRLSQMINKGRNPLVLIGHSFGGVLVQELHRLIQADKLVLISTIHSPQELPFQLRLLKYTRLHRLIRTDVLKCSVRLWGGKHGYDTPELKALFRQSAGQLGRRADCLLDNRSYPLYSSQNPRNRRQDLPIPTNRRGQRNRKRGSPGRL